MYILIPVWCTRKPFLSSVFCCHIMFLFAVACPVNTYKSNIGSCLACPQNSNTNNTDGNMKEGCVCDKGFQGDKGGPCTGIVH